HHIHTFPWLIRLFALILIIVVSPATHAAEERTEYRVSLTDVYGAYQSILARKDACSIAFPQMRLATDNAYNGWQARHKKLLDELDQRINMMIRGASRDEKDYAKNIGKYEGAILRQRDEVKQTLLQQPRAEFELECKALPEFLQSADSDLEKEFAEQLAVLRKRPLAKK
ncbi:MAG: hypothetical protein ACXWC0_21530, partial [Burkholderiales bacterium]